MKWPSIVILSGGVDSLVTLAEAKKQEKGDIYCLHFNYGQHTKKRELKAFHDICHFYKISLSKRLVVEIPVLKIIRGSQLTGKSSKRKTKDATKLPLTYVPFRNSHFLATAVSWAEVLGVENIYIGANEQDSLGYPDCRKTYYKQFNKLIKIATAGLKINIKTPIIDMKKKDIILRAKKLKAPIELSWSCYFNNHKACEKCESCRIRRQGMKEAGLDSN